MKRDEAIVKLTELADENDIVLEPRDILILAKFVQEETLRAYRKGRKDGADEVRDAQFTHVRVPDVEVNKPENSVTGFDPATVENDAAQITSGTWYDSADGGSKHLDLPSEGEDQE